MLLQRFPNGAGGSSFFQKRVPENAPDWLTTAIVSTPNGTTSRALVIADLAHLLWAVNLGCLGFHSWPVRTADEHHPDELRIDLDPQPGTTFEMVRETAACVRQLLDDVGMPPSSRRAARAGCTSTCRCSPGGTRSPCGPPPSPSLGSWNGAGPI